MQFFSKMKTWFEKIPYKKYISALLIFFLLITQTIRIDFFGTVNANAESYRDIVSIVVDRNTYGSLRNKINQYAEDIQGYLGGTRTQIIVVDADVTPAQIATKNEELFYEGDGDGVQSSLVGTILIGNIPIPMVSADGQMFPSVYPYVDFVNKTFIYNDRSGRYEKVTNMNGNADAVEIWHGVINPAVGRAWNGNADIDMIGGFLDKTHAFYTGQGRFAPDALKNIAPKVFYYDGFTESRSVDARSLFQYGLYIQNIENLAYNRYSKYLLRDINTALKMFDASNEKEYHDLLASLGIDGGSDTLTEDAIKDTPDIQTRTHINTLLKKFNGIFNNKVLGDELHDVYNAGRYTSGATVRADIGPVSMTLMDEVANNILKTANDALEKSIDQGLRDMRAVRKIPIFESVNSGFGFGQRLNYTNYFFGNEAVHITSPEMCTIARGSTGTVTPFGRDILTEANVAFDINTAKPHVDMLSADTEIFARYDMTCFDNGVARTNSYWWGNSILRITASANTGNTDNPLAVFPEPAVWKGFSEPIFSLAGMKESSRLPVGSLSACLTQDFQYTLKDPYVYLVSWGNGEVESYEPRFYPEEWNRPAPIASTPRYTCFSALEAIPLDMTSSGSLVFYEGSASGLLRMPLELNSFSSSTIPIVPADFFTEIERYDADDACLVGSITLDGTVIKNRNKECTRLVGHADDMQTANVTTYRSLVYHTIDGIMHHTSPTTEELNAAKNNGVTPNLAIDMVRYMEFVTPKGNIARITYPNFYTAPITTIEDTRAWLKTQSENQWKAVLEQENASSISESHRIIAEQYLSARPLSGDIPDWNQFISDEMIVQILQAKNWLHPDVTLKYQQAVESMLSYSHENPDGNRAHDTPKIPETPGQDYEIAYLGLTSFVPLQENADDEYNSIQANYNQWVASISGLNFTEINTTGIAQNPNAQTQCGPPEGVSIFQWPAAIVCWVQAQLPPKISAGKCGGNTIGYNASSSKPRNDVSYSDTLTGQVAALTGARVIPHLDRAYFTPGETITIHADLQNDTHIITPPFGTEASFHIDRVTTPDGTVIDPTVYPSYFTLAPSSMPVADGGATFIVTAGNKPFTLEGKIQMQVPLVDKTAVQYVSEAIALRVGREYLSLELQDASGNLITTVDPSRSGDRIAVKRVTTDTPTGSTENGYHIVIRDDISGETLATQDNIQGAFTLPSSISTRIGTYRVIVSGRDGVAGEMTFSVMPGALTQARFVGASSSMIQGSSTLVTLSLEDALGNASATDLHQALITIEGGKILDAAGQELSEMRVDMIQPYVSFTVRADSPSGVTLHARIDEGKINTTQTFRVFDQVHVQIQLEKEGPLKIGDTHIAWRIRILDASNNILPGFNSVAMITLPQGIGTIDKNMISITNGQSEIFYFTPGSLAGTHNFTLDIPGIGSISDQSITILPGDPLYINETLADNTITFTTRDRYGNVALFNGTGSIKRNADNPIEVNFSNGQYQMLRQTGYYIVTIPGLAENALHYSDASGEYSIPGIPQYATYITNVEKKFDFYPDYNARYTILAGGNFLREGEDILFHSKPQDSQSLAVSTLLGDPYLQDTMFSLLPWGGYEVGYLDDAVLEPSLTIERGYPVLTISDTVTARPIGRALYRMDNAEIQICGNTSLCDRTHTRASLTANLYNNSWEYTWKSVWGKLVLDRYGQALMSIDTTGKIEKEPSIGVSLNSENTSGDFTLDITDAGVVIAGVRYMMDQNTSVALTDDIFTSSIRNTPVLSVYGFEAQSYSNQAFGSQVQGYRVNRNSGSRTVDSTTIGPNGVDSFGAIADIPGVGWKDSNRTLLSYAAGDTVGEATRWSHTFTLINMGDPVAHVTQDRIGTHTDGVDRTVGTQIAQGRNAHIQEYFHKDMNNDGIEDMLVQYSDGYIELLLNLKGKFRSRGFVAHLPRLGNKPIQFADFQNDGYADIVSVDHSGSLSVISNQDRRFAPSILTIESGGTAPTNIQQMKIYDMDNDGHDDIVYLTSGGELGILYGTITPGTFTKNILDSSLGIRLEGTPDRYGGAFYGSNIPQIQTPLGAEPTSATGLTDTMIRSEVYYQHPLMSTAYLATGSLWESWALAGMEHLIADSSTDISNLEAFMEDGRSSYSDIPATDGLSASNTTYQTYLKSQYADVHGLDIQKTYQNPTHETLFPEDRITATITIKNTSNAPILGAKYLDTVPALFSLKKTKKYQVDIGGASTERDLVESSIGDYDIELDIGTIPAGGTAQIRYEVTVLPASYGEMLVGDFENGSDPYGDIVFKTTTTCGAEALEWLSQWPRNYQKNEPQTIPASIPLPEGMADRLLDANNNGIPDSIENMSIADRENAYDQMTTKPAETNRDILQVRRDGNNNITIDFDPASVARIEEMAQDIFNGLSCGFWGGSCMSFPINWAPLAPGNDPVVFGSPVGDGFNVDEGIPIFSAITGIPIYGPWGCYKIPSVWPVSAIGYEAACGTNAFNAGGYLGIDSYANAVRIFVTPTLTLGMGTAVCLGGSARRVGSIPWKGLSPLVQWGNCIVLTQPMPVCKWDGSAEDGDVRPISGLGDTTDAWNSMSCDLALSPTATENEANQALERDIISYMKNPNPTQIAGLSVRLSERRITPNTGPILNIGRAGAGNTSLEITVDQNSITNPGKVINVKNKRIAAFPDFIMDWLTRQTEELTNSLFTPPSLTIIPPTDFGQNAKVDSSYTGFLAQLSSAYSQQNVNNMRSQMRNTSQSSSTTNTRSSANTGSQGIQTVVGNMNAMRSAYTFIGKLPFVRITQTKVNINVPWILQSELDQYERQLQAYITEIDRTAASWCVKDPSPECLAAKAHLQDGALKGSIMQNLKRIEEYRRFPEKLQKYVNWKEKYLYQILCNIEAVEKMTIGWLHDNGIRFQKWAELYVLIKSIAESWQPLLDIFANTSAQCGVCRNERYNSQYWKFKLISMIIPDIPVIRFPKWPDIILDLSDVRLGMNISVPDFNFRLTPLRLPALPRLDLPNSPNLTVSLPNIPVLPALPNLPDLPNIPSLPTIKLPDLPPPPKLPKLSGAIRSALNILKIISKLYCYYQNTMLIPEWQVGDVIAQRTERQGTLSMDFLDIQFPQFSLPSIREIRVATHLNLQLKSDFITEFARSAVKPINSFGTDLQRSIPSQIAPNVTVPGIPNQRIDVPPVSQEDHQSVTDMIAAMEADADVYYDIDEFIHYFRDQLVQAGLYNTIGAQMDRELLAARTHAQKVQNELLEYNQKRFSLLKAFIREEESKTARTQNIIDLLRSNNDEQELLSWYDGDHRALFATSEGEGDSLALRQLAVLESSSSTVALPEKSSSLDRSVRALNDRVNRLAMSTTWPATTLSEVGQAQNSYPYSLTSGYSPKFTGIYILTEPSKKQVRLFDYTDLVTPKTRVDVTDIDQDGDKDYIFILGNALYVKYNHTSHPEKIRDTDRKVSDLRTSTPTPFVPNYFNQVLSSPSELNITFQNALPGQKEWRLEFYDRYIEWDRTQIGVSPSPDTPKTIVDLFVEEDPSSTVATGVTILPVDRSLQSGFTASDFRLQSWDIKVLKSPIYISLSPHRTIYTGNASVTIAYKSLGETEPKTLRLEPHTGYSFDTTVEIQSQDGPLFIIESGLATQTYTASGDLAGLPLLDGMSVISGGNVTIADHRIGESSRIEPGSVYMRQSLGSEAWEYNFNIPYPNGYYYARLSNRNPNASDRAGIVLLSPQASSDSTSPVSSLSDTIRVPVYTTQSFALGDIVTELSQYAIDFDDDMSVDANNNGIFDDDFDVSSSVVKVTDNQLMIGPFDTPENRSMVMRLQDEWGNTIHEEFTVEVYTPLPNIVGITPERSLTGVLDESIAGEPIHIWRIRGTEHPFLLSRESSYTDNEGRFTFSGGDSWEAIHLRSTSFSGTLNPRNLLGSVPPGGSIDVSPANEYSPMLFSLKNASGALMYQQMITLPATTQIHDTATPTDTSTGVFVTAFSGTQMIPATYQDPKIPWWVYLIDNEHHPLLAMAKDGSIFSFDPTIHLELATEDGNIMIRALRHDQVIANILFRIDWYYNSQ